MSRAKLAARVARKQMVTVHQTEAAWVAVNDRLSVKPFVTVADARDEEAAYDAYTAACREAGVCYEIGCYTSPESSSAYCDAHDCNPPVYLDEVS